MHITIETAGTVFEPVALRPDEHQPEAGEFDAVEREVGRWAAQHESRPKPPEVLRQLMARYEYQLKFVVASDEDCRRSAGSGRDGVERERGS